MSSRRIRQLILTTFAIFLLPLHALWADTMGCGYQPGTPNANASQDQKYNLLLKAASDCDKVHDKQGAKLFKSHAQTCKPTKKERSCTEGGNASVFIQGSCSQSNAKTENCDTFYHEAFRCWYAKKGVPISGVTGDYSKGVGCNPN